MNQEGRIPGRTRSFQFKKSRLLYYLIREIKFNKVFDLLQVLTKQQQQQNPNI